MRKTYCIKCKKTWEEPRDIDLKDSKCPECGWSILG